MVWLKRAGGAFTARLVMCGADAIAVHTDELYTPDGVSDLMAVCERVEVPVWRLDWCLHPLQLIDTAEAGAAAINIIHGVLNK
jgi:indole-3-glycerol phosphate synthase